MKLTTMILIIFCLHVSAGVHAQNITLNKKNTPLSIILADIQQQTGYDLFYKDKALKDNKVSIQVKDQPLNLVLTNLLDQQGYSFTIADKTITIRPKEVSLLDKITATVVAIIKESPITGQVRDEKGQPLPGATVLIKRTKTGTITDKDGNYRLNVEPSDILVISSIGYETQEAKVSDSRKNVPFIIQMKASVSKLEEVTVVSNGYQDLPKERATGSFEVITAKQLQHSTDPNLIKRLEGITTSMNFNNQMSSSNSSSNTFINAPSILNNLTIRGKNTLTPASDNNNSGVPLIIIDGIANPYSVDLINPNDVESVTILKDAAAASIWGSRAANGVIVVKTKRGSFEKPVNVSFSSNFSTSDKLDLFYNKTMSTSDYIDAEIRRFNNNNVSLATPNLTRPQTLVSPVDEILNQQRTGSITSAQANTALDALRGNDIRKDYTKYFLRNPSQQNYSLSIDGGSKYMSHRLSFGYDKTLNNTQNSGSDRISLNYATSMKPIKNIDLTAIVSYNRQGADNQAANNRISGVTDATFFPYSRLADDQGTPIAIPKNYRNAWVDLFESSYGNKVLSMRYIPLDDINEGYLKTQNENLNANFGALYKLNSSFDVNVNYNYSLSQNKINNLYRQNSYYMRNLINIYTDPTTFTRNIPLGGKYYASLNTPQNHSLRGQINFNHTWQRKHSLSAILGMDVVQNYSLTTTNSYYGYDENTLAINNNLDFKTRGPILYASGSLFGRVPLLSEGFSNYKSRTISSYTNAAYTYDNRYTISGSIRKDEDSQLGVGSNKGGTPWGSAGLSWNIANEHFYRSTLLPHLQFRATFGYNGNTNPLVSAYPIIFYQDPSTISASGLTYANTLGTTTNLQLRPEKTGELNLGLDFGFRNNRISGSIQYYDKRTTDLLSVAPLDPTTGFNTTTYNTGDLHGWGTELSLNSINIQTGKFSWTSNFLFAYNRVIITKIYNGAPATVNNAIAGLGAASYTVGYDLSRLFAYRWAGLDPATGYPRTYYNGQIVTVDGSANQALTNLGNSPLSEARYFGSAVPVYYGSLRNSLTYKGLTVSANVLYKFGYYFRRPNGESGAGSVNYNALFNNRILQGEEYASRWQKPGDEASTNVPSLSFPLAIGRDNVYQYSEINVLRADNIRLQEVNFSYSFNKKGWFIKNPRFYFNMSNLGVIWRANKLGIDPETIDYPIPHTYSFGFSANF